jgi:hypothetical protein
MYDGSKSHYIFIIILFLFIIIKLIIINVVNKIYNLYETVKVM